MKKAYSIRKQLFSQGVFFMSFFFNNIVLFASSFLRGFVYGKIEREKKKWTMKLFIKPQKCGGKENPLFFIYLFVFKSRGLHLKFTHSSIHTWRDKPQKEIFNSILVQQEQTQNWGRTILKQQFSVKFPNRNSQDFISREILKNCPFFQKIIKKREEFQNWLTFSVDLEHFWRELIINKSEAVQSKEWLAYMLSLRLPVNPVKACLGARSCEGSILDEAVNKRLFYSLQKMKSPQQSFPDMVSRIADLSILIPFLSCLYRVNFF